MATHFETVQWARHPEPLENNNLPERPFNQNLRVDVAAFSLKELAQAIKHAKEKKASGADDIPAEFWIALARGSDALSELLHLCNVAWDSKKLPYDWKHSNVVTLFKK